MISLTYSGDSVHSSEQNIKYLYNSPSFVNYNNHFNHFIFSVALLKPKFK